MSIMDVQHVAQFYQQLDKSQLHRLIEIYHPDVVFEDAAHRIEGFDALYQYFLNLYQNVHTCTFTIHEHYAVNEGAFLVWTMHLRHPKLVKGEQVDVKGVSHLHFADGKVTYHRDYFDMGEMLYEQLPVLGQVIRAIKRRLGQ
ncbi:nuclear transport factor 2 family protein [Vibrio cholerae]|nr:nuclear transport factor 2 family protein [Vibrio cholerae]TQP86465.1 nuclear transport factor 2 family protein [Vibrio cholerae]